MEEREISLVLGTAGHIDHGKTTLVKALTGVDCDRLSEEKKRGITIEPGYAPLRLGDGRVVSVVDVPGHERFIRQMVAGASGVDGVMLVVAADEGVMPQTREHLEILGLLGIRDGFVALTKTDMVDPELLELAVEDVRDVLAGTFLDGRAIVPVSSVTGANLDLVRRELVALVDRIRPRVRKGPFFLPVDRVFPMSGFGAVVTGTAYRGELRPGMEGVVLPSGREGRIRSVQVHGANAEVAQAGQRVAVSLAGVPVNEVARGDALCARGVYCATRCFECELHLLEGTPSLRHWQRVRLHLGTSDVTARVSLLEGSSIKGGETVPAQIATEEDVVCLVDQRFVIRRYSPLETIAGGRVLVPFASKPRGGRARSASAGRIRSLAGVEGSVDRLRIHVESAGTLELPEAVRLIQEPPAEVARMAESLSSLAGNRQEGERGGVLFLQGEKKLLVSPRVAERLAGGIRSYLAAFHEARPSQKGTLPDEVIQNALKEFEPRTARAFLEHILSGGDIEADEGFLRLSTFTPRDDELFAKQSGELLALCERLGFQPPLIEEAALELGMEEKRFSSLLKGLRETGKIAIVSGFILSAEVEGRLLYLLMAEKEGFTLARVRDLTNSTRKFILPLLEYLDAKGYTRRAGEARVLLSSRLPKRS